MMSERLRYEAVMPSHVDVFHDPRAETSTSGGTFWTAMYFRENGRMNASGTANNCLSTAASESGWFTKG